MSYLVLARKYRPQTFDAIVGQEHVTRTLANAIQQERLHHAFLFTGARGVGKTTAARILAKCLSCVNAPTAQPCNACEACQEITSGASVDVQEIDAASNNGVDNIRELRESIRYAPVRGKKKVYILDEVHMLSSGAWNALLKTLEEPPPHAVFVFATTDPHKLPATILSRVQRYDFRLVPVKRIVEHLAQVLAAEGVAHDAAALTLVAREAGGSVRDALSLLDQVLAGAGGAGLTEALVAEALGVADRGLLDRLIRAVLARDAAAALGELDAAFSRGFDLAQLAHALCAALRDLVVAQAVADPSALIDLPAADVEELARLARGLPAGLPELLFQRMAKLTDEVARAPVPRHLLEVGLVELTRIEPLEPLVQLIERLEALEARLERGGAAPPRGTSRPVAPPAPARPGGVSAEPPPAAARPVEAPPPPVEAAPPPVEAAPPARPAPSDFAGLVEAVIARDPMLSSLAMGRLVSWEGNRLSLAFDKEFAADGVRERLGRLREILRELTGRDHAVEIVVGPAPGPLPGTETLIEVEQRKVDEDRERRVKEALEHPARRLLDEKFGGTWKEPVVDLPGEARGETEVGSHE